MTLRTCSSISFRLIPYYRVHLSTYLYSTAPPKYTDYNEKYYRRHKSNVVSEPLWGNKNKFNHDWLEEGEESFKDIFEALRACYKQLPSKEIILSSINYLKELGFSNEVILESAVICAYPRFKIKEGLKKLYKNELKLNKVGLFDGFTQESTNNFKNGTHSCDKRLQLCLYYIEEPYNFRHLIFLKRGLYEY